MHDDNAQDEEWRNHTENARWSIHAQDEELSMSNSPRYVGFIDPPYAITITDDSGTPLNLTGCTSNSFTLTMVNVYDNTGKSGVGAWTVTNAAAGQASYQYASADMDT